MLFLPPCKGVSVPMSKAVTRFAYPPVSVGMMKELFESTCIVMSKKR